MSDNVKIVRLPVDGLTAHSILFLKAPAGVHLSVVEDRTGSEVVLLAPEMSATFVSFDSYELDGTFKGCEWEKH